MHVNTLLLTCQHFTAAVVSRHRGLIQNRNRSEQNGQCVTHPNSHDSYFFLPRAAFILEGHLSKGESQFKNGFNLKERGNEGEGRSVQWGGEEEGDTLPSALAGFC